MPLPDEARRWLDQSSEDLEAARRIENDPELPPRLAAFLAHLAAEKALKGALVAGGTAPRRVHDLVALAAALPVRAAACVDPDDVDLLGPWNSAGRYPADVPEADPAIASAAVRAAERLVSALIAHVREHRPAE